MPADHVSSPADGAPTPLDPPSRTEADRVAARVSRRVRRTVAIVIDALMLIVFAIIGRNAHHHELSLLGILDTLWPFAAGAAVGWVVVGTMLRRERLLGQGVVIWLDALIIGLLLRWAAGDGVAWPFPLIAALTLGVLLLGWRLVYLLVGPRAKA